MFSSLEKTVGASIAESGVEVRNTWLLKPDIGDGA